MSHCSIYNIFSMLLYAAVVFSIWPSKRKHSIISMAYMPFLPIPQRPCHTEIVASGPGVALPNRDTLPVARRRKPAYYAAYVDIDRLAGPQLA
jgi:hypothetical protein